ncbi:sister chromatid cohesion protein DCC1 [Halictus rubicundus]|uniref:sister chromatid cohesion protein DCC1 n=1 Tax=Halictus rubicundus TaxID=77578 RepID=UPI0040352E08
MLTLTVNNRQDRTMEEIRETLELADIKESDLQNLTQILYSATDNDIENCTKLLELDQHLLETIEAGDSLSFQGNKEDSVVICTKSRTYDVKEAETSNSCLLVPNLNLIKQISVLATNDRVTRNYNISGVFHTYYEVRECKPKLEKLLSILEPTSFHGKEYESKVPQELLYDWDRLRSEVQASEDELSRALNNYLIADIDGYYRLLSFKAETDNLTLMLGLFDRNSWELDQVDKEATYESLKEFFPKSVFDVLFAKYTEASSKSKQDGTPLYRYIEEKCCKTVAQILLNSSTVTEQKQFMKSWHRSTPEKMEPKEEYLSGVALVMVNGFTLKKEVVSFLDADLSNNINERFNELFKMKDKWTMQEIAPYVSKFTTDKINVNALLTKYARCSMVNGVKYYSSKHGK